MRKAKVLIFDLDRVLVRWFGNHDSQIPIDIIAGLTKFPLSSLLRTIELETNWISSLVKYGVDPRDRETLEKIDDRFFTRVISNARAELYPWVKSILPELAKIKELALLTNNGIKSAHYHLGGLLDFFQVVKTWENVPTSPDGVPLLKPEPDGVLSIMEEFGAEPGTALIIEDSISGVIAGKRAGVRSVFISWEYNLQESLIKSLNLEDWVVEILRDPNNLFKL